jgi:phosphoenolpyruvate phosphomutase
MRKTVCFRKLLTTKHTEFVMQAHNALSARIVEEAGFKAIWAGGWQSPPLWECGTAMS